MNKTCPETVAFIFARGGSKGLPRKNIRLFAGKPLIAWAIEQGKAMPSISRVIVSTDDHEIATIAREYGAETPFIRPEELARDTSPEWLSWRHALAWFRDQHGYLPATMVSLPSTAPLRAPIDIERCLDLYERTRLDIVITAAETSSNPSYNLIRQNENGTFGLIEPSGKTIVRRQDASTIFKIAGLVYVSRPEFVLKKGSIFSGRVGAVIVPAERAIDIDTLLDFRIAEFLMKAQTTGWTEGE